jgi:peptidyl-prolyl cis-trans isomerase A (cyclophilin A)
MNTSLKIAFILVAGGLVIWGFMNSKLVHDSGVHVVCQTTKGQLDLVVMPEWSPRGAKRFLQLVDDGFFTNLPLFRCISGFVCQFGSAPPRPDAKTYLPIQDDPPKTHLREFKPGYLSFAGFGPNSRSTHMFVTLGSVKSLGTQPWETPFGFVTEKSMQSTLTHFTTVYGEVAPSGRGPKPQIIESPEGAEYLKRDFPLLDSLTSCSRKK